MSIIIVKARIECDGCGCQFYVEVDPGDNTPLFSMIEERLRNGLSVEPIGHCKNGMSSIQTGKHLCPECTRKCDAFTEEDRDLTEDEINEALE